MKKLVPNFLTLSRICLMPLSLFWLSNGSRSLALISYLVIAISDYGDGALARKWNTCSQLGIVLDQVSDKLVGLGFFWGLVSLGLCPVWFAVLITTLSLLLGLGYLFSQLSPSQSGPQPSLRSGKWSTGLQYFWIGCLIWNPSFITPLLNRGYTLLAILQFWVFIQYVIRLLRKKAQFFSHESRSFN